MGNRILGLKFFQWEFPSLLLEHVERRTPNSLEEKESEVKWLSFNILGIEKENKA